MTITNSNTDFLSCDNLHYKPLHVHTFKAALFISTKLARDASPNRWHGHVLRVLSVVIRSAACMTHIPFALVESLFFLVLTGIGCLFQYDTKSKSEFLQKYTVRSLAHSVHSLLAGALYFLALFSTSAWKSYATPEVADQLLHLGTASFIQLHFGHYFDTLTGRYRPPMRRSPRRSAPTAEVFTPSQQRTTSMLIHALPHAIDRIFQALSLEFNHENMEIIRTRAAFREIIPTLFTQITWGTFVNPERWTEWMQQLMNALVTQGVISPPAPGEENTIRFNTLRNNEANYQKYLQSTVKEAWLEIHNTDALAKCLSEKNVPINEQVQNGKEALECFYPAVYIPVANYTQFKELTDSEVKCPDRFECSYLQEYNDRLILLTEAKAKLQILNTAEKETLIKKLLMCDDVDLTTSAHTQEEQMRIQTLFNAIGKLGNTLHQGRLLNQTAFNIVSGEPEFHNLFQRACQEAANSLSH